MERLSLLFILLLCFCSTEAQRRLVGGPCEGCEAIFEYGDKVLTPTDTLPEFNQNKNKIMISGTVYHPDGTTPAEGVILYFHHTNAKGVYPRRGTEKGWGRRHGYLRTWVKTGRDGKYGIYTFKPGSYPSRNAPAHIHLTVYEPNGKYYWLEDYVFEGDPLLKDEDWNKEHPRGGHSGLMKLKTGPGEIQSATRDIILGKNVNDYND